MNETKQRKENDSSTAAKQPLQAGEWAAKYVTNGETNGSQIATHGSSGAVLPAICGKLRLIECFARSLAIAFVRRYSMDRAIHSRRSRWEGWAQSAHTV